VIRKGSLLEAIEAGGGTSLINRLITFVDAILTSILITPFSDFLNIHLYLAPISGHKHVLIMINRFSGFYGSKPAAEQNKVLLS